MKRETGGEGGSLLSLKGVSAGYTGMPVLRGVSLDVQPREIVALVGSNGAGKTTLLRALSRVIPAPGRFFSMASTWLP